MTKEEIAKHLTEILDAWEAEDDKGRRDFFTNLRQVLETGTIRRRYLKLHPQFRQALYRAMYPYDEDPDIEVTCPHCGKRTSLVATASDQSTASGYWRVVESDGHLYLDWHENYECEVSNLLYECEECGESLAGDLYELEELWAKQREQSTNESLGILGQ